MERVCPVIQSSLVFHTKDTTSILTSYEFGFVADKVGHQSSNILWFPSWRIIVAYTFPSTMFLNILHCTQCFSALHMILTSPTQVCLDPPWRIGIHRNLVLCQVVRWQCIGLVVVSQRHHTAVTSRLSEPPDSKFGTRIRRDIPQCYRRNSITQKLLLRKIVTSFASNGACSLTSIQFRSTSLRRFPTHR